MLHLLWSSPFTSKTIYHRGCEPERRCIADIMFCHGTQTMDSSRICLCLLFHEQGKQNSVQPFLRSWKLLWLHTRLDYILHNEVMSVIMPEAVSTTVPDLTVPYCLQHRHPAIQREWSSACRLLGKEWGKRTSALQFSGILEVGLHSFCTWLCIHICTA